MVDDPNSKSKEPLKSYNFALGFFYLCSMEGIQCKGPLIEYLCNLDECSQQKLLKKGQFFKV